MIESKAFTLFLAAAIVVIVAPGPDILYVIPEGFLPVGELAWYLP